MQDTLQNPETPKGKPRASSRTVTLATIMILVLAASLWFLLGPAHKRTTRPLGGVQNLQMNPAEREYRKKIEVANLTFSRAENFLHQEVTVMNGEVHNSGTEAVSGLRITTEFLDDMNQIVLRETRGVLGIPERVLAPGERRAFEISFDHVPNSWNMQQPAVRVEYLQLPASK